MVDLGANEHGNDNANDNPVKIVAFTNTEYAPVAQFWYKRMTELNYTTHTLVLFENDAVEYFANLNTKNAATATNSSTTNNHTNYRTEVELIDPKLIAHRPKVRSLWYHRILYCLNQLKNGTSILL